MKTGIHPEIHADAKVTCTSCKAVFTIPGTQKEIQIEICSNCHPVYTGKYRGITSSGQVEKFQKKLAKAKDTKVVKKAKRVRLSEDEKFAKRIVEAKEKEDAKKAEREEKKHAQLVRAAKKTIKKKAAPVAKATPTKKTTKKVAKKPAAAKKKVAKKKKKK
jgi:large subunit ribosomal protein L31